MDRSSRPQTEARRGAIASGPDRGRAARSPRRPRRRRPLARPHQRRRGGVPVLGRRVAEHTGGQALGANIDLRDPTVDGGPDVGSCAPGDVTDDANAWVIQALCPAAGAGACGSTSVTARTRRVVQVDLPITLLGGTGADKLTTAGGADAVAGDDGDDVIRPAPATTRSTPATGTTTSTAARATTVIEAGLGVDTVAGGEGNDDLRVRDGIADTVSLRAGRGQGRRGHARRRRAPTARTSPACPPRCPEGGGTHRARPHRRRGARRRRDGPARRKRLRVKLVATSCERGTIAASGFIDDRRTLAADQREPPDRRRRRRRRGADRAS